MLTLVKYTFQWHLSLYVHKLNQSEKIETSSAYHAYENSSNVSTISIGRYNTINIDKKQFKKSTWDLHPVHAYSTSWSRIIAISKLTEIEANKENMVRTNTTNTVNLHVLKTN